MIGNKGEARAFTVTHLNDRRKRNCAEANHSLGLEISKEGEGVDGNVRCGIGMTQARHDGRRGQRQKGDDRGSPLYADEIDRLPVGDVGLNAGHTLAGAITVGHVDEDFDGGVQIREGVGNTRDLADSRWRNVQVERQVRGAGNHGTKTREAGVAGIDGLADDLVPVGGDSNIDQHVALPGGHGDEVDEGCIVVRGEDKVEELRRVQRVVLA